MGIEFIEGQPPEPFGSRRPWRRQTIAELQEKPGVWAIVRRGDAVKMAHDAWTLRQSGCQAVSRKHGEESVVYACWPEQAS